MLESIFAALDGGDIRYAIVGGLAVTLHGHLRSTADVDVVLALDDANLQKFVAHFQALGWKPHLPVPFESLLDAQVRSDWIQHRQLKVFSVFHSQRPAVTLDVLLVTPISPEELVARAVTLPLFSRTVSVVAIDDLITMKRAVGRAVDLSDILALEALNP